MADVVEELTPEQILEARKSRFRVLACVDGSDESYRGLRYAADVGHAEDADVILLYVRPVDQGMRTGGLQVRVARENMLNWGLELPGIQYLKKGRDQLIELGEMASNWGEKFTHTDVDGDPLGDNKIEYRSETGKSIVLKLKVAPSVAAGILDQYELGPYNLIILGASGKSGGIAKALWDPAIAEKVAMHAPCSVLAARDLRRGHGHLICTDGSEQALAMARKSARLVHRTELKNISVMSVALEEENRPEAQRYVDEAVAVIEEEDLQVRNAFVRTGNPVEQIIEAGEDYSLILVGESGRTGLKRFFMGSVAFKVLEYANKSVMVVR
ncbi:MAG: universal stress protein [Rhodospirillales bacterium]|nr:universal stress protein [Rhodospirillales bacterium]